MSLTLDINKVKSIFLSVFFRLAIDTSAKNRDPYDSRVVGLILSILSLRELSQKKAFYSYILYPSKPKSHLFKVPDILVSYLCTAFKRCKIPLWII